MTLSFWDWGHYVPFNRYASAPSGKKFLKGWAIKDGRESNVVKNDAPRHVWLIEWCMAPWSRSWQLSRLSHDVKDFCQIWEFFKKHRATFVSLKENFDTSTPIGEMMVINCISFSQFERKTIVQRIKDGARARACQRQSAGS